METYESKQKRILKNQATVYEELTDLRNVEKYLQNVPKEMMDKAKDVTFEADCISFNADMVGRVEMKIVDRETPKMVKFGFVGIPVNANLWVQFVGVSEMDTRMKVTVKADIPFMLKPMIGNKLEEGVERFADMLAMTL